MTLPRERTPYSAIVDRPPLPPAGGNRIVFWTIVNVEVWDITVKEFGLWALGFGLWALGF